MYVPDVELHECATLDDAASLMHRFAPNIRLLAGGTDVLVDLKTGRASTAHLVSLIRIASLRGIAETSEGLQIGALTTITELNRSPLIKKRCAPLLDASRRMAAPPIRNVATVGGNIASAVPCADLPPILMTLHAEIETWSPAETRRLLLERFFLGPRATALQTDEILAAVIVPDMPKGFGAAYERFGLREGNAIAVASVAASLQLDGDEIAAARLVLGAVAPIPKLVEAANEELVGRAPDADAFKQAAQTARDAAEPISDVRGTAEFRRELIEVLTPRALAKALERAREARP